MRPLRPICLIALSAATAGVLAACSHHPKTPPEQIAAQTYLTALGQADGTGAARATNEADTAQPLLGQSLKGLGSGAKGTLTVTGLVDRQKTTATANYEASWTLPDAATEWTYTGSLPMVKVNKTWLVDWKVSDIQPALTSGHHLLVQRTQPRRGQLTDDKDAPLFTETPVVTVGINTGTVKDLTSVATTLAGVAELQSTAAEIVRAVQAAPKNQFVPIITLRRPVYLSIKARIYNLLGTQFSDGTELLPPETGFARYFLGEVGPATKELIDGSNGAIKAGDQVGTSGVQLALDSRLRGTPGITVVQAAADDSVVASIATVTRPVAGEQIKLTLDTASQKAADAALADESLPASVVVTQPSTGRVLAVANSESAPGDIALTGQYPAGSTFKIATYTADFTANPSHSQDTPTTCPPTTTVDGRVFENENKFSYGTIPYSAAFGYSCNTTAINVADALPDGTQYAAAKALGLGGTWKELPVDVFSGSMPSTATGTEKAAEAIGQGKVLVSPLLMAEIVGASATGKPITPSVLADTPGVVGKSIDPAVTAKMNAMMRATVALPGGTAYASLNGLPGNIEGKTGTAEFGTDVPPKSHSWFAGVRGDLAISVFIYGGEQSTTGAVVLAQHFFQALPPS